jgi:hypothetical protein
LCGDDAALVHMNGVDDDIAYSMTLIIPICVVTFRITKLQNIQHTLRSNVMVIDLAEIRLVVFGLPGGG